MYSQSQHLSISPSLYDSHNDRVLMAEFHVLTKKYNTEGFYSFFYGDTKGVPTIGIGHAVHTLKQALNLPLYIDNRKATHQEITKIYNAVSKEAKRQLFLSGGNPAKSLIPEKYKELNEGLFMDEKDIALFYEHNIRSHLRELKKAFHQLSIFAFNPLFKTLYEYPFPAQLALLDMTYNMGAAGLFGKKFNMLYKTDKDGFPMMLHAIRKGDFQEAAMQSRRKDVNKTRNEKIRRLFQNAQMLHDNSACLNDFK